MDESSVFDGVASISISIGKETHPWIEEHISLSLHFRSVVTMPLSQYDTEHALHIGSTKRLEYKGWKRARMIVAL